MSVWRVGSTGTITFTFANRSGVLADATAAAITIYSTADRSTVVASTSILPYKSATGTYYYDWVPDAAGDYIAKVTATVAGEAMVGSIRFRVTDPLDIALA